MAKNGIRERNRFDPASKEPFKISRSKLDQFLECPRCFYLDRRLGIGHVDMPAFTLNSATDTLLKKEFDTYRVAGKPHPLMTLHGIKAVPFRHPDMDEWRENFKGVHSLHAATNLIVTGAPDDIWIDEDDVLHIVDYKSTSTTKDIDLEGEYKQGYKRQMEIYQWLLRRNGFNISDTGYFLFVNADTKKDAFDGKLVFRMQIIEYSGKDDWVEDAVLAAHECLVNDHIPSSAPACKWCAYTTNVSKALKSASS